MDEVADHGAPENVHDFYAVGLFSELSFQQVAESGVLQ